MIKRYVLHVEAHRNVFRYRPRVSFKREPRPGDRVVDGGVLGTLRRCPACREGLLHEPDPPTRKRASTPPKPSFMDLLIGALVHNVSQPPPRRSRTRVSYHTTRAAVDFNAPEHVELKVTEPKKVKKVKKAEPVKHVELNVDEPQPEKDPILLLEFEDGSPETLKLDYTFGRFDYKSGDIVWTHKAEYVVEKLENHVLYLVRKDVWDERKKAKHVELKSDESSEHVELKDEEEPENQIVELKFN